MAEVILGGGGSDKQYIKDGTASNTGGDLTYNLNGTYDFVEILVYFDENGSGGVQSLQANGVTDYAVNFNDGGRSDGVNDIPIADIGTNQDGYCFITVDGTSAGASNMSFGIPQNAGSQATATVCNKAAGQISSDLSSITIVDGGTVSKEIVVYGVNFR